MSFAKYAQFYRDNGFFSGSKIIVTVGDNSLIGQELILSKGSQTLQTRTIPVTGIVEFFTDASGTLTASVDNGTTVRTGTVKVSAYGTYNMTLSGAQSDSSRTVFANDVNMTGNTAVANIAYTGDVSTITASASDTSLVRVSVNGNKINIADAGNDKQGKCTITATVAATSDYNSASKTFNVNKISGSYGSWADASDDVIASMIAKADAGEIDLADYWNIGDTRRVHLNAIAAGTEVAGQNEQDIDLVIMHNPLGDNKYMLTTPTAGNRYQPNFIIGTKDCLENKSAMGYFAKTITANYSAYSYSNSSYMPIDDTTTCELLQMLNNGFVLALPQYLQDSFKMVERKYVNGALSQNISPDPYSRATQTNVGTASHKISIANLRELGFTSAVARSTSSSYDIPSGIGVYNASGKDGYQREETAATNANNAINNCGTKFAYYNSNAITKKKGLNGSNIDYLLPDAYMYANTGSSSNNSPGKFSLAFYISNTGVLTTNDLIDNGQRTMLRGVSPIMFI